MVFVGSISPITMVAKELFCFLDLSSENIIIMSEVRPFSVSTINHGEGQSIKTVNLPHRYVGLHSKLL